MPDFTMCASDNCPNKANCYRKNAKPSKSQSFALYESVCNEVVGFVHFIEQPAPKSFLERRAEKHAINATNRRERGGGRVGYTPRR
jgi:hypothetical protein